MNRPLGIVTLMLLFCFFAVGQDSPQCEINIFTIPVNAITIRFWDPSCDKPVDGVVVKAIGPNKHKKLRSNAKGEITFSNYWPRDYKLVASKYGFTNTVFNVLSIGSTFSFYHTIDLKRGYASSDATPGLPNYDPCVYINKPLKIYMHVP